MIKLIALVIVSTTMCVDFAISDELISPPRGPVPTVDSELVDKTYIPIWDGPAVEEESETRLPTWSPDALPSMPYPDVDTENMIKAPPGHVLVYDGAGKQHLLEVVYSPEMGEGPGGTQYPGLNGEDVYGEPRTFSNLVLSNNPSGFPASTACRVFSQVTDINGGQWALVGSAHMIDARTAVTAGHVLYVRTFINAAGNTVTVNNWVDNLQIFPGSHQGVDNWGGANMVDMRAWTNWTNNGDWDWDVGLIRVDRAVGMLSGWTGWFSGGNCNSSLNRTYFNNSYPIEACGGNDGNGNPLHNGQDMYFSTGQFDSCFDDNQLQFDTVAGCFTALWGGMSGSGYYFFDDNNERRVHAVASWSNRSTIGRAAKIFAGVNTELDDFIPESRGADFDLQLLFVRDSGGAAEPVPFDAGDFVSGTVFTAANPTNGTGSGTWSYNIYLSTDDDISDSDTLLAEHTFDWNFQEMSQVNVAMQNYQLPLGVPSNTYWIGAILDDATDGDSNNNDTDTWDAMRVLVQAVSDPAADSVEPITSEVFDEDLLNMDIQVSNNGSQPVSFDIEIRASTNQNITDYDYLLGTVPSGWLGSLDTWSFNWDEQITDSLPGGDYYLGLMIVNTSGDVDLTNNTVASDTTFTKLSSPENDDCMDALAIGLGDYPFSTLYATTDGEAHPECEESGDGGVTGNDIWYGYQCYQDGILTVSTCDQADYDTDLVVYRGFCGSTDLVACNDDGEGCSDYSSYLEVPVTNGEIYMIRVGGWKEGHTGSGVLTITFETGIEGDFNNDGQVDIDDLLTLIAAWGGDGSDGTDLNGDGVVNIADLLVLIANWN
jgi:hypothetical protein